jgi:hypothetical protein
MFSMRFNARLDTSHHGQQHSFKDTLIVADSLTGIHNAMVKHLFAINRSCVHRSVYVSPHLQVQRFEVRWAWRSCSGSASTYPSGGIGVIENISHSTDKLCRGGHHACTTFALWLPMLHLPVHVGGNLGSGCLWVDVVNDAGLPNSHQQSLPVH